jgi:hypothetical protein
MEELKKTRTIILYEITVWNATVNLTRTGAFLFEIRY